MTIHDEEVDQPAAGGNCTNIAVLLNRYVYFCQQLSRDADPRLREWIACIIAKAPKCGYLDDEYWRDDDGKNE